MRGFFKETIVELVMSRAIWLYAGFTVLVCLITLATGQTGIHMDFNEQQNGGAISVQAMSSLLSFFVFLMVVGSSGIFPRMLRKGTIDFYLSRPLSRTRLLFLKFLSLFCVYALLLCLIACLFWVCWSVVTKTVDPVPLLLVPYQMYCLVLWMGVAMLAALIGRSQGIAIMSVMVIWVGQTIFSQIHTGLQSDQLPLLPSWLRLLAECLYYVLPKVNELATTLAGMLNHSGSFPMQQFVTTSVFMVVIIFLAVWRFRRTDY